MKRKSSSPEFKAKVALAAVKGIMTAHESASKCEVHPVHVSQWKKAFLDNVGSIFDGKRPRKPDDSPTDAKLYEEIRRLKIEVDWLRKNRTGFPKCDFKKRIKEAHPDITTLEKSQRHSPFDWASDSTERGYMVAVMDWYARKVLSWRLSKTTGKTGQSTMS